MIEKKSYILILIGVLGFVAFIFLRPETDFYAGAPVEQSRSEIEEKLVDLSVMLGFSMDSLEVYSYRTQHGKYFESLEDTLGRDLSPKEMSDKGRHLHSWVSEIGKKGNSDELVVMPNTFFEKHGNLSFTFSNSGKVIRMKPNENNNNPTFLAGNSPIEIAENLVGNILGYDLTMYQFLEDDESDSIKTDISPSEVNLLDDDSDMFSSGLGFRWKLKQEVSELPKYLSLNLESLIREYEDGNTFKTEFGYKINSFIAKNEFEPDNFSSSVSDTASLFAYFFYGSLIILIICTFSVGLKNIFKGKVEWRRALFMFTSIGLAVYGWRAIYYMSSFSPFYNDALTIGSAVNNLVFGLAVGAYMALAYVGWEALARSQNHKQLSLVDAFWQRKVFVRETGAGLIEGFALGGILIGVFSGLVFLAGLFYLQADSQFGFAEPTSKFQLLTMNMSAWSTTWLIVFVEIAFVYGLIKHWVSNKWVSVVLSVIVTGVFISTLGRMIGTNGDFSEDFIVYMAISVVSIIAYRQFGIVTLLTGWWVFICAYLITPYWDSSSIEVAYISWTQLFIIAGPLIFGLIAYKYGIPLSEVGDYIPEYEERISQHLRVEREIEIARESQYKLMPVKPPEAEGFDVFGFFLPSFEVGGDYYDYILSYNKDGSPKALNMVVVDVSGKAMRAAMPAIFTSGLLLSRMKEDSPAQILSEVSEPIFNRTDKRTFITCAIARYCLEDQILSVANAGHCKPILKRNGKADFIQTPDPKLPLGMKPDVRYENLEFKLKKGDFLLLYSDGLPEATNEAGEWFGFEEVPALVEKIDTELLSAKEIAQEIKRTIQKFSNYQLADDTTVICLKI